MNISELDLQSTGRVISKHKTKAAANRAASRLKKAGASGKYTVYKIFADIGNNSYAVCFISAEKWRFG